MKIRRVRALMVALALVFVSLFTGMPARAEADGVLRVMLTRLGAPDSLTLSADCDYYLESDPTARIPAGETARVTVGEGGMTLAFGDSRVALGDSARLLRAETGNRGIKFIQPELSNRFCGDLSLSASGGVITAILNIYVENYLYGVVGYAMPPSAGIEALKAMAVVARTAALRRRSLRGDAAYDLTDTGELVFKGYNASQDYASVIRAVDDTRGGVMYYDGALVQCAFCASNGGQTESSKNAGGPALEYSTVRDDPYDYNSESATVRSATVNKDLTGIHEELYKALTEGVRAELEANGVSDQVESFRLVAVESVTACESRFAAPSRLYKSLTFKLRVTGVGKDGTERTGSVSVSIPTYGGFETWYDLSINPEDNETVWVTEGERAFTVAFRRSGSGVGMSQRGAQAMAEKGMRVSEILTWYYPGVEGRRLELSEAVQDRGGGAKDVARAVIATARLTDKTDLLDTASDDGAATATVAAGAVVEVYAAQDEWAYVGLSGKVGYTRTDKLEALSLGGGTAIGADEVVYGRARDAAAVLRLPDPESDELGAMPAGTVSRVMAWSDAWCMLEWQGQAGFVAADILEMTGLRTTPEPSQLPTDPNAFVPAGDNVRARLKQDAPLFETPNALATTLTTLKQGDIVTLLAYSAEWARVRTQGGREGCLRLESITALEDEETVEIEGGPIQRVKGKKFMFVSAGSADVYKTWSADSERVETLYYGERVQVGAYNGMWACVRFKDVTGYVPMAALAGQKPAGIEGGPIVRADSGMMAVVREDVSVYDTVAGGAKQSMSLTKGQRVSVAAYNGAWALVRVDGTTGYVRLQYLERE